MRIIDLALKDLYQIVRDWKAALFLVVMPIAFTLLMGYVFGDVETQDTRLPVAVLNEDTGTLGAELVALLEKSELVRPESGLADDVDVLPELVAESGRSGAADVVAALHIPADYSARLRENATLGGTVQLRAILDRNTNAGITVDGELQVIVNRLHRAVRTAAVAAEMFANTNPAGHDITAETQQVYDDALAQALAAWDDPPLTVRVSATGQPSDAVPFNSFAHSSAGIMVQFVIAGLTGAAEIVVLERKSRTLQRMLTTSISKAGIIAGHFIAMFVMVLVQIAVLIIFGQLAVSVPYFRAPLATLVMALALAFFGAGLGMLIGALSKNEDQVVVFSLLPMFVLSALGGAWMPLETTSETFQTIGHLTPTAWAVDGLKNITLRGLGLPSVLLPAAILLGFGIACLAVSVWLFKTE